MDTAKKRPAIWSNVKALFFGLLVSLVLIEIILRIFHPFPFRIQHGRIVLPANQHIIHKNPKSNKLEPVIYYSRNSIGLRGDELPKDPANRIKIITIGGSTTECAFNSDSLTWPELLKNNLKKTIAPNLWLNNAGLDGTSTFGHIILLRDHIINLHPDYVLFLIGLNDTEEKDMGGFDNYFSPRMDYGNWRDFLRSILKQTEIGGLFENIYRYRIAYNRGLVHRELDYKRVPHIITSPSEIMKSLQAQAPYLESYRKRILTLDSICQANHIKAIFLTQPSLFASFTDPATSIDFTNLEISKGRSAVLQGQILKQYNDMLLNLGSEHKITTINLAAAMPLDSRYYYDYTHYTSIGTRIVAQIVADSVARYMLK